MNADRPSNAFLRALSESAYEQLAPHLSPVHLTHAVELCRPDDRIQSVYFPLTCIISVLTTTKAGESVETSMIGNEGGFGVLEACGNGRTAMQSLAQVDGWAMEMPAATFRQLVMADEDLGAAAWRLIEHQITESRQSGMCNALHGVEPRLARWLVESLERSGGRNPLPLTQEFVASMLGVQRTTVTSFATQLQKAGLISYARGQVELVDPKGLEHRACECRDALRRERTRLNLRPIPDALSAARHA